MARGAYQTEMLRLISLWVILMNVCRHVYRLDSQWWNSCVKVHVYFLFYWRCQVVLQTDGANLFSSQLVTKYCFLPSPPAAGIIKSFIFHQSKRQKVESHLICVRTLFIFFFILSFFFFFLQLSSTLMKITYNNFRDLNMLAFLESMRYDTLPEMIKIHILARC